MADGIDQADPVSQLFGEGSKKNQREKASK
jgi:hypothetical protein